jgi:hypothetical protein
MMQGTPTAWQYTDDKKSVVTRTYPDGSMESCVATRDDVVAWVAAGNTIQPAPDLAAKQ